MTDADGDLVQHYGYMPFGNERYQNNTEAFSVTNRYTGQQLDEETGLYFYGSRYYDPQLARFIQPDSVVPDASSQSLNRYSYCYNNPLNFCDPSGHDPITLAITLAIIGAGVGGGIAAAQGGNFWKGALAGGIAGFCAGYGWGLYLDGVINLVGVAACAAGGGALGALVTGGDPGIAAATAGISAGISGAFGINPVSSVIEDIITDKVIRDFVVSTGVGALVGGISAEIFGGSFGQGALWGAAGAAASFTLTTILLDHITRIGSTPYDNDPKDVYMIFSDPDLQKYYMVEYSSQDLSGSCIPNAVRNLMKELYGRDIPERDIRVLFEKALKSKINWNKGMSIKQFKVGTPKVLKALGVKDNISVHTNKIQPFKTGEGAAIFAGRSGGSGQRMHAFVITSYENGFVTYADPDPISAILNPGTSATVTTWGNFARTRALPKSPVIQVMKNKNSP